MNTNGIASKLAIKAISAVTGNIDIALNDNSTFGNRSFNQNTEASDTPSIGFILTIFLLIIIAGAAAYIIWRSLKHCFAYLIEPDRQNNHVSQVYIPAPPAQSRRGL